ncbi:hypothetical protein SD70_12560 [Gordoniibacillus kamchatkensis]|uniref:DNA-binding response regulator n=1 Tax=Gordoniibacillus kamchatkensis TaxID=1590651 RepID=A0ABR5AHP5_9BACL|nr:response regulator transcription factor [Paenibacillus sp. VKM B-2647]KIL40575.1 hypothetical protein SD70_12560 [Paenibacillus sp. VKM B-2647]
MYSLLIVDDEKWVRQGLRSTIDWEAEQIEVLGEAQDGEEALELIRERPPDIIITDIKMPHMDGLALIEEVKNSNLPSKIIIVSGYSDFSSAQKAIRYGAADYVLKPIEETQVLSVVRRCVEQINREQQHRRDLVRLSECIRESLPLARQRYVEMLLTYDSASFPNWRSMWNRLDIRLDPERLRVMGVKVLDWGTSADDAKGQLLLRYALGNMAEEFGAAIGKTMTCPLDRQEDADLAILQSPFADDDGETKRSMEALIEASRRYLGIRINIGISRIRDATKLHASFQEAVYAGAYAFYDGYGQAYEAARLVKAPLASTQPYKGPNNGWDSRFAHAVKLGKEDAIAELIQELARHLQASRQSCAPYELRKGLQALLQNVAGKLEANQAESSNRKKLSFPYCTLSELEDVLWTAVRQFQQTGGIPGNRKRFIEQALSYLAEHYAEDISMNLVAKQQYLNPSYFSKIFHEETGETFSKYVIRLRMEKAKQLLKDSSLKIYEVAQQVGYHDFRHFIKLFKDYEGLTPAQYRDSGLM